MKKIFLTSIILFISCNAISSFIDGEVAFNERNYSQALEIFQQESEKGDYKSQFYLGKIYLYGLGVEPNTEKGLAYLQKSADQGYDSAQALLGFLYEEGRIVPQDTQKAINFYKAASAQNNISAMFNLGVAYYNGQIISKDIHKAIELLEKVPADVIPMVGRYLGDIYLSTNDLEKAIRSYEKSAKQKDVESYYALANIYAKDFVLPGKAITYYTYAASQRNMKAQYVLGIIYANGDLVDRNIALGHAWLKMSTNQNFSLAKESLKQLEKEMSESDLERAHKEFLHLQQHVLDKLESPFIEETRYLEEIKRQEENQGVINTYRRWYE